jgi:hypothetical protein
MKSAIIILILLASVATTFAQENYNDFVQQEAKRYKGGGIAMLVSGVAMIGGGAAMIYNKDSDGGATAMGATLIGLGVGLDVASIFVFKKRRALIDNAKASETAPLSLYLAPNGATFTYRF